MSIKRSIAGWLCPELVAESDRHWRMRVDIQEKVRWLGHDFPMVEVVLARIAIDDLNWSRSIDEKAMQQEYPNLGGHWPSDIYSFREKMRSTFGTFPTPRSPDPVGGASRQGERS
jgi:hypothetical protein